MISWEPVFIYSVEKGYNNFSLFIYFICMCSSLVMWYSILSLRRLLLTLPFGLLWLCREFKEIVEAFIFFTGNCSAKKLLISCHHRYLIVYYIDITLPVQTKTLFSEKKITWKNRNKNEERRRWKKLTFYSKVLQSWFSYHVKA